MVVGYNERLGRVISRQDIVDQKNEEPVVFSVGPDRRDLMTLVLAVVIGLSFGPMVLGRFIPDLYDFLFIGSGGALVEEVDLAVEADREKLVESGVSEQAVKEYDQEQEQEALEAEVLSENTITERQAKRSHSFTLLMHGMLLAVVFVMMLEVLTVWFEGYGGRVFRGRLIQGRYLLVAGWLVLFLVQPGMYLEVSFWFVVLLVLVVVALGFVAIWSGKREIAREGQG